MSKKTSKLRNFAKQYRMIEIKGYKYVECPSPAFQFLDKANWTPLPNDMQAVAAEIGAIVKHWRGNFGYFYHLRHACWYVVSHLWLATLPAWGNGEMKNYMTATFTNMMKNSHEEPALVVKVLKNEEVKKLFDDQLPEPELVEKEIKLEPITNPLLLRLTKQVEEEISLEKEIDDSLFYLERYGVSKATLESIKSGGYHDIITDYFDKNPKFNKPTTHVHILDICKALYKLEGVPMNDIYLMLENSGYVICHSKDNKTLTVKSVREGLGCDVTIKGKKYPTFTPKGMLVVSMLLMDSNIIKKPLLFL